MATATLCNYHNIRQQICYRVNLRAPDVTKADGAASLMQGCGDVGAASGEGAMSKRHEATATHDTAIVRQFPQHRALLLGVAYRLLGSVDNAEDTVQDAWLRWSGARAAEAADVPGSTTAAGSEEREDREVPR